MERKSRNSENMGLLEVANESSGQVESEPRKTKVGTEMMMVFYIALPTLFTLLFEFGLAVITLAMVGRLGKDEQASAGQANMYQTVTIIFGFGVLCAMDTLVSQAHGAQQPRLIGLTLMRSLIVVLIVAIPICALWVASKWIFLLLQFDSGLADKAGNYCLHLIPGLIPFLTYIALQKYLQNQEAVAPAAIVGFIVNLFHIVISQVLILGYIFVPSLKLPFGGYGFVGAPIALALSRCLLPIGLLIWIVGSGIGRKTWPGISMEIFDGKEIRRFLFLGIPAGVMIFVESFGFEVNTLMASYVGSTTEEKKCSAAAQAIVASFYLLIWMIPQGFAQAACVRVGTHIGEGSARAARKSALVCFLIVLVVAAVNSLSLYLARKPIAHFFQKDDEAVRNKIIEILPLAAICHFMDCCQSFFAAVLRGVGRPIPGAAFNVVAYYIISIPSALLCSFKFGWGLVGIWMAFIAGTTFVAASLGIYVLFLKWDREVERAKAYMHVSTNDDMTMQSVENDHEETESNVDYHRIG